MRRARPWAVLWLAAAAFNAGAAALTMLGGAWVVPAAEIRPDGGPIAVEGPELMKMVPPGARGVGSLPDGIRFWSENELALRATFGGGHGSSLWVVARGRALDGVWPLVVVHVDREPVAGFFVTSRAWGLYRVDLDVRRSEHHVRLRYANDDSRFPTNRDLDLAAIRIGTDPPNTPGFARWSAPGTVAPALMSEQVFAEPSADGLALWPGGRATDLVRVAEDGVLPVVVRASVSEGISRIELRVDDAIVATFEIRGSGATRAARVPLRAGWHRFEIRRAGGSRDAAAAIVTVHAIRIGAGSLPEPRRAIVLNGGAVAALADDLESSAEGEPGTLWSDGWLRCVVVAPEAGTWTVTVRARGDSCEGAGPRVLVMAGDDQWAELRFDGEGVEEFPVALTLDEGPNQIFLVYDNDTVTPGVCDRNLHVEALRFESR